jgi:Protein of unknown function (DUF2690)
MLKRRILGLTMATAAVIGSVGGLGFLGSGAGLAASAAPAASAAAAHQGVTAISCSYANGQRVRSRSWINGNETRIVYLWYSNSTACAWAVEVNGQPGDEVWVYNENTGAIARAYIQSGQHSATTGEIYDGNGTKSHACMLPLLANGSHGPRTCTGYY